MREQTFHRVLVPLDGSALSSCILPWVGALAGKLGLELHLITVTGDDRRVISGIADRGQAVEFQPGGTLREDPLRLEFEPDIAAPVPVAARATDMLEAAAGPLRDTGLTVHTSVVNGDPPEAIVRAAHATRSDVIAMATHGRVGVGRGLLGSTTDRVMHASDVPLLIVRPEIGNSDSDRAYTRFPSVVLAALDGSDLAEACIPIAVAIARRASVDLRLVRAYESPNALVGVEASLGEVESTARRLRQESELYLNRKAAKLREQGLSVTAEVMAGPADDVLARATRRWLAGLLIIGTRGRSGLTRWVLGSVTDKVVRSAGRPVLVIPPRLASPADEPEGS